MHAARRIAPVTAHVTPELAAELRARAADDGRTLSTTVERILRAALAPSTTEAALDGGSGKTRGTARDVAEV